MMTFPKQNRLSSARIRQRVEIPLQKFNCRAEFFSFSDLPETDEHIAVCFGDWRSQTCPLVRIHSECLTGDVFSSGRCDCGPQLEESIRSMSQSGGIILYMRQEGRGIGLYNKLDAYRLQDIGYDTFEANQALSFPDDLRNYKSAAVMLKALNVSEIELLSNNPDKQLQLEAYGINVKKSVSTQIHSCADNRDYLEAKIRHGHRIALQGKKGI